jgi:hypothetical protein
MPWYYAGPEAKPVGPVTLEELQALRARGVLAPETYVIEQTGQPVEAISWKRYQDIFSASAVLPNLPPLPPAPPITPPAPPVQPHPLFPSAATVTAPRSVFPPDARPDVYPHSKPTNNWCAWGLGFGLVALFFSLACGVGVFPALLSFVMCIIGLLQLHKHHEQGGQGLAITGLVLSTIALIISLIVIIFADLPILKAHGLTVTEQTTNDSE